MMMRKRKAIELQQVVLLSDYSTSNIAVIESWIVSLIALPACIA